MTFFSSDGQLVLSLSIYPYFRTHVCRICIIFFFIDYYSLGNGLRTLNTISQATGFPDYRVRIYLSRTKTVSKSFSYIDCLNLNFMQKIILLNFKEIPAFVGIFALIARWDKNLKNIDSVHTHLKVRRKWILRNLQSFPIAKLN